MLTPYTLRFISLAIPALTLCGCRASGTNETNLQPTAPAQASAEQASIATNTPDIPAELQAILQKRKDRSPIQDITQVRPLVFVVSIPSDGFRYSLKNFYARNEQARISAAFPDFKPNFEIDFDGDGIYETQNELSFTYPKAGTYQVSIRGELDAIIIGTINELILDAPPSRYEPPKADVLALLQWGDIRWKSMANFANNCKHMQVVAKDTPDLTDVRSLAYMFANAEEMNADLSLWDISNVTTLEGMFQNARSFNQPLNTWNTSKVTDISKTFDGAESFNQPLDKWDVSNVTKMNHTFAHASSFNQPLNAWNTSRLTELEHTFWGADHFNQPLDHWDVSNVNSFYETFRSAESFNQPLESWDVSNARTFSGMFDDAVSFNQPLEKWNVSNADSMWYMFQGAENFNQPLEKWDVSNVDNMNDMFNRAIRFNQPLNAWNTKSLRYMNHTFERAASFNQPLDKWDVSHVDEMYGTFDSAVSFNQPLDAWKVSEQAAQTANKILSGARSYTQKLPAWIPEQDFQAKDWVADEAIKKLGLNVPAK